ncbi:hypothetical protein JCM19379_08930 [Methyloparacoccus murrellii]|jgi:hypothetical protein
MGRQARPRSPLGWLAGALTLLLSLPAQADEDEGYINLCLTAWGDHPFKGIPHYQKYSPIVNIFGIGQNTDDLAATREPALVLIDTGVNLMGGTTIRLLNPNGWYCFRSNINIMGKVTIKAHCNAHIASASEGLTFLGEDQHNQSTTVMGLTHVELIGCEEPGATQGRHGDEQPRRRQRQTHGRAAETSDAE